MKDNEDFYLKRLYPEKIWTLSWKDLILKDFCLKDFNPEDLSEDFWKAHNLNSHNLITLSKYCNRKDF
jgi:hypothetical protein